MLVAIMAGATDMAEERVERPLSAILAADIKLPSGNVRIHGEYWRKAGQGLTLARPRDQSVISSPVLQRRDPMGGRMTS
jgi:hypothetical protein